MIAWTKGFDGGQVGDNQRRATGLLSGIAASILGRRMAATFMRDVAGVVGRVRDQATWTDGALALTTLRRLG
jgi:hypothetical protein